MKNYIKISFTILLLSVMNSSVFSQSNYTLDVDKQVVGSDLIMDLYIQKTTGTDFALSSCNFAITVDTSVLDLANVSKDASYDGPWDAGTDAASYLDIFIGKGSNFFNVNVLRNVSGTGTGQMVTSTRTQIARVVIPIKNNCSNNTSDWVVLPAAQNKYPLENIKQYANFVNPGTFPLCESPAVPTLTANGNDTICEGDFTQLSTTITGDIQWYLNGAIISGATNPIYNADINGVYTVEAINCLCKTASLDQFNLLVNPLPIKPVVNSVGNILTTNSTQNLQWYVNGEKIENATTSTYEPMSTGSYTLGSSNDCGEKISDPIQITLSSVEETLTSKFEAYPNPYVGETTISYTLVESGKVSLNIYNLLGEHIHTISNQNTLAGEYSFKFNKMNYGLAKGVYLLKLTVGEKSDILKLVELN